MHFYRDHVYPFLVKWLGNPEPIRKVRERVIPLALGTVLEVGIGTGANFVYYRPRRVSKVYALEPNPGMIRLAKKQQHGFAFEVEYMHLPGERIPLNDNTVDTVVSSFTLCTIDTVKVAIGEIRRVLKPGGRLIFIELGMSPDPRVQRLQKLFEPIVHRMFAGLYITRNIPHLLSECGLKMEQMDEGYLAEFPKTLTYCWWGTFVEPSLE